MSGLCDYSSIRWERGHAILNQSKNPSGFRSYEHQDETWKKMDGYFSYNKGGIIWIPTGGGKTVVAAKWLLENAVEKGYKVIWFANRGTLLEQAAETFKGILQQYPALKNKQSILCALVLSQAAGGTSWKKVRTESEIVFASLSSSTKHTQEIHSFMETSDRGVFIVFDEVQHAYAPTYRRLLGNLKDGRPVCMIGLSATPYRMTKEESIALWMLFSAFNRSDSSLSPIHRVFQQDLINRKLLAKPRFYNYHTLVEPVVEEGKHIIDRYNELTAEANTSLAINETRNQLICDTYIQNFRQKQGIDRFEKTIIFTPNILGNQKLYDTFVKALQNQGYHNSIRVAYLDSTRSESDRKKIVERFRTPKSQDSENSIDILINVEMCTEGFDAPLTRTIFLARPTNSEALVRQMMGRAMRGPKVRGNEICHIVRFVDTLPEGYELIDPEKTYAEEGQSDIIFIPVPKEVLRQFQKEIDPLTNEFSCILPYTFDHIPFGWFYFQTTETIESDSSDGVKNVDVYVMFLEHQQQGYGRIINDLLKEERSTLQSMNYKNLIKKYFYDCKDPLPSESLVSTFIDGYPLEINGDMKETKIVFEERGKISPPFLYDTLVKDSSSPGEIAKANIENLFTNNVMLDEFYHDRLDLTSDLETYSWYRENEVIHSNDEIEPELCRAFIKNNQEKKISIPFSTLYQNLCESNPNLYTIPFNNNLIFIESEWIPVNAPLAFCRFTDEGIEYHLSTILYSKSIPVAIREFVLFQLTLHAAVPYEHHGPIFQIREAQFSPTDDAKQEFLRLPIWKHSGESLENGSWAQVCRQYLTLFIFEAIRSTSNHITEENQVNVDDYL